MGLLNNDIFNESGFLPVTFLHEDLQKHIIFQKRTPGSKWAQLLHSPFNLSVIKICIVTASHILNDYFSTYLPIQFSIPFDRRYILNKKPGGAVLSIFVPLPANLFLVNVYSGVQSIIWSVYQVPLNIFLFYFNFRRREYIHKSFTCAVLITHINIFDNLLLSQFFVRNFEQTNISNNSNIIKDQFKWYLYFSF